MVATGQIDADKLRDALKAYAVMIKPWAVSVATYMVADVGRRNLKQWRELSREIGTGLRAEIESAPTGALLHQLMEENVHLITSLPSEAADKVHEMIIDNLSKGVRSSTFIPKLLEMGDITEARARTIARTETARAANGLTRVRAAHAGSEGYIWRTSKDGDVRESHKEMEGAYVRWDTVPTLSDGTKTHAGEIYNCRCFAEPIFPEN